MLAGIGGGAASLFAVVLLSGGISLLHPYHYRGGGAAPVPLPVEAVDSRLYFQSLCFAGWLVGHVLLALHMRTAEQPVVVKVRESSEHGDGPLCTTID